MAITSVLSSKKLQSQCTISPANKNLLGLRLIIFVLEHILLCTHIHILHQWFRYDFAVDLTLSSFIFVMLSLLQNTTEMSFAKLHCKLNSKCIVYHFILSIYSNVYIYHVYTNYVTYSICPGCKPRDSPK